MFATHVAFKEDIMKVVGKLWEKKKGKKTYLTGVIDLGALGQVNIGIFVNDKNDNATENAPTHNVCLFEEK